MNKSTHLMHQIYAFCLVLGFIFLISPKIQAQISQGGTPYSFGSNFKSIAPNAAQVKAYDLPSPNWEKVHQEDQESVNSRRFAVAIPTNINLNNAGEWTEMPNGDRVWRLKIRSEGAQALRALYSKFWLPEGGRFFVYNEDKTQVKGAFTNRNHKPTGRFATGLVLGDHMILEYYEPASVRGQGIIDLLRVDHAYRNMAAVSNNEYHDKKSEGFGDSGSCNINVNCSPIGDDWQDEKRGVARIVISTAGGADLCTGSLINNTNEDNRPLFLSANHCLGGNGQAFVDTWEFIFNYEASGCSNPGTEPSVDESIIGATILSASGASDFLLLELSADVPVSFNAYFNGWDKGGAEEDGTVSIHHPSGDIKKISQDNDFTTTTTYSSNTPNSSATHFRVVWEEGTTEGGSSGSPLFDMQGHIVGQLHGGGASCSNLTAPDWYGKVSVSWDGGSTPSTRLSDYLDPAGTGATTLAGKENALLSNNLVVNDISSNVNPCGYSNATSVQVQITNQGTNTQSNLSLSYELRRPDNSLVQSGSETVAFLASLQSTTIDLALDLSEQGTTLTLTATINYTDGTTDETPSDNTREQAFMTNPPSITSYPYSESFESGAANWMSGGTNNEWELGAPASSVINTASDGTQAWVIDLDAGYGSGANAYLLSPVFDLSSISNPELSVDVWVHTEENYDGVQMQVSTDCGQTWTMLGNVGTGTNWHNNNSGNLSFSDFGFPDVAWAGEETAWKTATQSLSAYAGESQVQFRFLFVSDGSVTRDGFGVDNFLIVETATNDDVAVTDITNTIAQACDYTASTPIEVTVRNQGSNTLNNITLDYELRRNSDNALISSGTENIASLASSANQVVTVNVDLSENGQAFEFTATASITITDENMTNNSQSETYTTNSLVSTYPYTESFESGAAGWTSEGLGNEWELGTPSSSVINTASDGTQAWVFDLDAGYGSGANAYLLSPVFDLSSISNPKLSVDVWVHTEENYDGVQMQVSTDCGQTWTMLGNVGTGTNWHNNNSGNLSFSDFGFPDVAWAGEETAWKTATQSLSAYAGESQVQFRFLFVSDGSVTRDGFGVDNFQITGNTTGGDTRIIALSGNLNFGDVQINTTAQRTLTITNNGSATLTVSSLALPSGYSADWNSGTIAASASQNVNITFAPTALQAYNGTLTVNADHTSGSNTMSLAGNGVADAPTSLEDRLLQQTVVFPNPAQDQYFLEIAQAQRLGETLQVEVYDSKGVLLSRHTEKLGSNTQIIEFSAKNLAAGTYILRLQSEKGVAQKRLIIQK